MTPTVLPPSHRSPKRRHVLGMGLGMLASSGLSLGAQAPKPVRVAAASDLKFVLTHLLDQFQQETGIPVQASFGSSGNFVRQIWQGLPVDLFMSADQAWVRQLIQAGMGRRLAGGAIDEGAIYGRGRIAIFLPRNSTLPLDARLQGLKDNWGRVSKFAIANPEHAPYGRAAREALMRLGLWELVAAKLVLGENIAQATQFVTTGAAQAGITALSLALAPELASQGRHLLLDEQLHAPLIQRMILLRTAQADAARLYDYLLLPAARALMRRYGLDNPA